MKKPLIVQLLLVFSVFTCLAQSVQAKCLSKAETQSLWRKLKSEMRDHPKMIYSNHERPKYTGFWLSNENHYYSVANSLPEDTAGIHVGFGTTGNYNILGSRTGRTKVIDQKLIEEPKTAVFADQSDEALIAMMSFWRPMWLISKTPVEFLANVLSLDFKAEDTPYTILERNHQLNTAILSFAQATGACSMQGKFQRENLPLIKTKTKLHQLVTDGTISQTEYLFSSAVLDSNFYKCDTPLFPKSVNIDLSSLFEYTYDPAFEARALQNKVASIPIFMDRFKDVLPIQVPSSALDAGIEKIYNQSLRSSFILNQDNFQRVRQVYINGNDYYAKTFLDDGTFWNKVGEFAQNQRKAVTDVYLTCILQDLRDQDPEVDQKLKGSLNGIPGKTKYLYESTCETIHPTMKVIPVQRSKHHTSPKFDSQSCAGESCTIQ